MLLLVHLLMKLFVLIVQFSVSYLFEMTITTFLATSNGLLVKRQKFFVDAERKLKLLQKRVSQKKLGSNNWKKASEESCQAARVHCKLSQRLALEIVSPTL